MEFLTENEAKELVYDYYHKEGKITSLQEIIDAGEIPRLKGYKVRPGKVSDCVFGGKGSYEDKETGKKIEFENPPLNSKEDNKRPLRIMVRTERISTHDISRGRITFKDQILAANHNHMRRMLEPYIGTSQIDVPGIEDNGIVIVAENLRQFGFENVLRTHMAKSDTATSLYVHYNSGSRYFCGHSLPHNLFTNGPLPYIMDTPSTKSARHDESISPQWLFTNGICSPDAYRQIISNSILAYGVASEYLRGKDIIAPDTKTEHGYNIKGEIVSQDEIWTMDSTRFWPRADYLKQLDMYLKGMIKEINPKSLSKQFARDMSIGEQGYTIEQRLLIATRYVIGSQHLMGKRFVPDTRPRDESIIEDTRKIVGTL